MRSIETKYVGPTNNKGSRIIATEADHHFRIVMSYDPALNSENNHMKAATMLCDKINWHGKLIGGHTKAGMVFVWDDAEYTFTV